MPAGVRELTLHFEHLSPLHHGQGRPATPRSAGCAVEPGVLYSAGHHASQIRVQTRVKLPADEFTRPWNGQFRRPVNLTTPDRLSAIGAATALRLNGLPPLRPACHQNFHHGLRCRSRPAAMASSSSMIRPLAP